LLSFILDKTVKLWKISEKTKRAEGYNLRDDNGIIRSADTVTNLRIPVIRLDVVFFVVHKINENSNFFL